MEQFKQVKGDDIIIKVNGKAALHATTHNLKIDMEVTDFRTKDTKGKQKLPGDIGWSVDGEGLVIIDPSITNASSSEDILSTMLLKQNIEVVLSSKSGGLSKIYTGKGYFTSFSLGAPSGETSTYSYSITGDGDIIPSTLITE